jgi:peptide/nickel transport system permease protein
LKKGRAQEQVLEGNDEMQKYIIRTLIGSLPSLLGVSLLVFSLIRFLPGDPVLAMFAESGASEQVIAQARHALGLDEPIPVQYARFITNALRGDLGRSMRTNEPVINMIAAVLPATVQLAVVGIAIAFVTGIGLGILAALKMHSIADTLVMVLALLAVSMPSFWLGMVLILLFGLSLGWLPVTSTVGDLKSLILPAVVLGFSRVGIIARLVRSSLIEVLHEPYIATARAKGLFERRVVTIHAMKNALLPVLTVAGLQLAGVLNGAVVIETVFSRQGIGFLVVQAILTKDYAVVQGVVLVGASVYILVNLTVDILYGVVDPRISRT